MAAVETDRPVKGTLAAIASHPTRIRCYFILAERTASPNEMARAMETSVDHVAYHVRRLKRFGAIELVGTEQRRGATEHYYRAVERPMISSAEWAALSRDERASVSRVVLQHVFADAVGAEDAGTFDSRTDRSLIRLPVVVDDQGFAEISALHDELYERTLEIWSQSLERLGKNPESKGISAMATTMLFEQAPGFGAK